MKYSKLEIKHFLFLSCLVIAFTFFTFTIHAQEEDLTLREPPGNGDIEENAPSQIDLKAIPNFPSPDQKSRGNINGLRGISSEEKIIPINGRLRLVVDDFISSKTAMAGDYFKSHILEDFFLPTEDSQLIVPKGSWLRGKISLIKKPNIFTMSAKFNLHLSLLSTPQGEVIPLDTEIDVQKGILNEQGFLEPLVNSQAKVEPPTNLMQEGGLNIISVNNLDFSIIGKLLTGHLTALFLEGDNASLSKGQELQILLKKDIKLVAN